MRILLSCPYAWDAPGGVQVHVRQLARVLQERGHEVVVVTPAFSRTPEPRPVRIVGRALRVPYRGTVAPICFSRRSFRRIKRIVEGFRPDVLHAHEPLAPSTSMLATFAATAPVVATFHAYADRSRLMEMAGPVLRTVHRRISASIAVSEAAAEFLARSVPAPVEIVPNGIDVDRFATPGPPLRGLPPGRWIVWVNRLDPQKGFPVLVRAFARLASELDDVHLLVAGDGVDRDALELLSDPHRQRVRMLGTVRHDALPRYLAAADVFVSPAVGQESFGIVLVEAMAAGIPVVASDIPGYREVVRDGTDGLLVPPQDPDALATAIRQVLQEHELASALVEAGRERAQEFSWKAVVPRLEAVYRRVAGDGA